MSASLALLRPYRAELIASAVLAGLLVAIAGGAVLRMQAFGIPATCFSREPTIDCAPYQLGPMTAYYDALGMLGLPAMAATLAIPVLVAIVLGVALVAREIEQQTTVFAWSMAPSRARWLLRRAGLLAIAVIGLGLIAGLLGDAFASVRQPHLDPYQNFEGFGSRGPVLAATALLAFGLALQVGALLGRQLPTLLLGGVLLVPALLGVSIVSDAWLRGDTQVAVLESFDAPYPISDGARTLDSLIRTPDGEVINWEDAYSRYGQQVETAGMEGSDFNLAVRYVPAEIYPLAVTRLTAMLAGFALLAIALAALIVHRRRPYQ